METTKTTAHEVRQYTSRTTWKGWRSGVVVELVYKLCQPCPFRAERHTFRIVPVVHSREV